MSRLPYPYVCLVTDRRQVLPDARTVRDELLALERWLDDAIGAVDLIQIRERDVDAAALGGLAARIATRARESGTVVVVGERADIALAASVGGVHVRADGPPVNRMRAIGPADWLIGRSVHDLEEVRAHQAADYLVFGTVFPSRSKPAGAPTRGVEGLAEAARASTTPVLAIGGVDPAVAWRCRAAGAAGLAAIGIFLAEGRVPGALGLARAAARLREAWWEDE